MQIFFEAAFKILQLWVFNKDPSIHAETQAWKTAISYLKYGSLSGSHILFVFLFYIFVCIFGYQRNFEDGLKIFYMNKARRSTRYDVEMNWAVLSTRNRTVEQNILCVSV